MLTLIYFTPPFKGSLPNFFLNDAMIRDANLGTAGLGQEKRTGAEIVFDQNSQGRAQIS